MGPPVYYDCPWFRWTKYTLGHCLRRSQIRLLVSVVGSTSCLSIPEHLNWGQGVPRKPEESRVARLDGLVAASPPSATLILLLS